MAEYPFTLQGAQRTYNGNGRRDGETYQSLEFELKPGLVYTEIEHHGRGDFKLEFVPTKGFSRGEATAASLGGSIAAGVATGAAIGSIVPVAGTILGGIVGGAAGWLAGEKIEDAIAPIIWTPADAKGECSLFDIVRVREGDDDALPPGKYRLEVQSQSKWSCRFIQPALGQSSEPLTDDEDCDEGNIPAGHYIVGPYKSGARPLLASIRHTGGGEFFFTAYALDGTHQYPFANEGQFIMEEHPTEIRPGKEYMLLIVAEGEWFLTFTEGY